LLQFAERNMNRQNQVIDAQAAHLRIA